MIDVTTASDEFLDRIASGTIRVDERIRADTLLERQIRAAHRLIVIATDIAGDTGSACLAPSLAETRDLWDARLPLATLTAAADLMRALFASKARRLLAAGHDTS